MHKNLSAPENNHVAFLSKDILGLVATYLSLTDYASLKTTCRRAYQSSCHFEGIVTTSPTLLFRTLLHLASPIQLRKFIKQQLWFNQKAEQSLSTHLADKTKSLAEHHSILACYALLAPTSAILANLTELNNTIDWLKEYHRQSTSGLLESLTWLYLFHTHRARSVESFRKFQNNELYINLREIDFSGMDISYFNFSHANLRNANFTDAQVQHASFRAANLYGATFLRANLYCTGLAKADLRHANFHRTYLLRADLNGANLCNANLRWAVTSPLSPLGWFTGIYQYDYMEEDSDYPYFRGAIYNSGTKLPLLFMAFPRKMVKEMGAETATPDYARKSR